MIWRYNSGRILAVDTRNLLWLSKTANKKTEDVKVQFRKYDLLAQIVLYMNYQQKKSYLLASKYAMSLQKILGVTAQLIKIFHESRVRNRASLLFAFDYICGWKGKSSKGKSSLGKLSFYYRGFVLKFCLKSHVLFFIVLLWGVPSETLCGFQRFFFFAKTTKQHCDEFPFFSYGNN